MGYSGHWIFALLMLRMSEGCHVVQVTRPGGNGFLSGGNACRLGRDWAGAQEGVTATIVGSFPLTCTCLDITKTGICHAGDQTRGDRPFSDRHHRRPGVHRAGAQESVGCNDCGILSPLHPVALPHGSCWRHMEYWVLQVGFLPCEETYFR